jgi:hypothetical protein
MAASVAAARNDEDGVLTTMDIEAEFPQVSRVTRGSRPQHA